ncbi:MAG: DUF2779 domain-containing protein [Gammaproteobacteria bacterium]|nr:DUF2779 domain-containing protein [Gammaproteobacteria bacterium]
MPTMLSKSRILAARQCSKRLWLEVNRPELRVVTPDIQRRFDQGHRLNDVVHHLLPDGHLITSDVTLGSALALTKRHLARQPRTPLFEGTFSRHRVLVRADILQGSGHGWRLTEVKSSTRVKPYHLDDCAVQAWVIGEAGYPVSQTVLAHVDTGFTYRGNGDYQGLLRHVDVSERIQPLMEQVPAWVTTGLDVLAGDEPDIAMGSQCTSPFGCPFIPYCSPEPTEYPVSLLPNAGKVVNALLADGIDDVRDIPEGWLTRPRLERVRVATVTGKPYVARELADYLAGLAYPRYYLDFESIQFAVPIWADTHPYEQLPFQWSCQVEEGAELLHEEAFLDDSGRAPMRACAERLIAKLGDSGPILTYSPFERQVIRALGRRYPDLGQSLDALAERIVDLLPVIRQHYYHPAMRGSFSIKAVLPTVAPGSTYDGLDVKDGVAAQVAFEEAIDPATDASRRNEIRQSLLTYCALDTLAMVQLVRFLSNPAPFDKTDTQ